MQNPELHAELSRVIESVIQKKASQRQLWREDHITLSWIEALQDSPELRRPAAGAIQVEFKAWKLSGRMEFTHGDVAVLARIRHPETSTCFEGCAFLEAKRSEPTAPFCYRHFNPAQYQRFSGLAAHRYVLYRREAFEEPVPNADDPNKHLVDVLTQMLELGGSASADPTENTPDTPRVPEPTDTRPSDPRRTSTLPSYLLSCFKKPLSDGVFSAGVPLATQIHRYCHGWDLEPIQSSDQPAGGHHDVPFLLTITAALAGTELPKACEVPSQYAQVQARKTPGFKKPSRNLGGDKPLGFG